MKFLHLSLFGAALSFKLKEAYTESNDACLTRSGKIVKESEGCTNFSKRGNRLTALYNTIVWKELCWNYSHTSFRFCNPEIGQDDYVQIYGTNIGNWVLNSKNRDMIYDGNWKFGGEGNHSVFTSV
jgi:hypothetical protein